MMKLDAKEAMAAQAYAAYMIELFQVLCVHHTPNGESDISPVPAAGR